MVQGGIASRSRSSSRPGSPRAPTRARFACSPTASSSRFSSPARRMEGSIPPTPSSSTAPASTRRTRTPGSTGWWRARVRDVASSSTPWRACSAQAVTAGSFEFTLQQKERSVYFAALRNGDAENWFGALVSEEPADLVFDLSNSTAPTTRPSSRSPCRASRTHPAWMPITSWQSSSTALKSASCASTDKRSVFRVSPSRLESSMKAPTR